MMESLLTLIFLLLLGACIGVGAIIAILYISWDKN